MDGWMDGWIDRYIPPKKTKLMEREIHTYTHTLAQASKASPILPPVARVAWDNSPSPSSLACPLVAVSYLSHGTHVYRVIPAAVPQPLQQQQQPQQQRPASVPKGGKEAGAKGGGAQQPQQQSNHALSLVASLAVTLPSGGVEVSQSIRDVDGWLSYIYIYIIYIYMHTFENTFSQAHQQPMQHTRSRRSRCYGPTARSSTPRR
jgi:hypothetical protein